MGSVDETLLRRVAARAAAVKFVTGTAVCSVEHPDAARLTLDLTYYPDIVQDAALVVRTYTDGDFNVVYREDWGGSADWRCRWDRHDNPHNARDHFHHPPDCSSVRDHSHPADFFDVFREVLAFVQQRLGEVWDDRHQP